jgi:hypothetical protein
MSFVNNTNKPVMSQFPSPASSTSASASSTIADVKTSLVSFRLPALPEILIIRCPICSTVVTSLEYWNVHGPDSVCAITCPKLDCKYVLRNALHAKCHNPPDHHFKTCTYKQKWHEHNANGGWTLSQIKLAFNNGRKFAWCQYCWKQKLEEKRDGVDAMFCIGCQHKYCTNCYGAFAAKDKTQLFNRLCLCGARDTIMSTKGNQITTCTIGPKWAYSCNVCKQSLQGGDHWFLCCKFANGIEYWHSSIDGYTKAIPIPGTHSFRHEKAESQMKWTAKEIRYPVQQQHTNK